MSKIRRFMLYLILCGLAVAALSGGCAPMTAASGQPIATYPKQTPVLHALPPAPITTRAYLELVVKDTDHATTQAIRLASDSGGYLTNYSTWEVNERRVAALEFAIPYYAYPDVRSGLLALGRLVNENVSPYDSGPQPLNQRSDYVMLSVQLRENAPWLPPTEPPSSGWDPGRTLRSAWEVFVTIFGFLADAVIWVLVVAGPFILLGLLVLYLVRRYRRARP